MVNITKIKAEITALDSTMFDRVLHTALGNTIMNLALDYSYGATSRRVTSPVVDVKVNYKDTDNTQVDTYGLARVILGGARDTEMLFARRTVGNKAAEYILVLRRMDGKYDIVPVIARITPSAHQMPFYTPSNLLHDWDEVLTSLHEEAILLGMIR